MTRMRFKIHQSKKNNQGYYFEHNRAALRFGVHQKVWGKLCFSILIQDIYQFN